MWRLVSRQKVHFHNRKPHKPPNFPQIRVKWLAFAWTYQFRSISLRRSRLPHTLTSTLLGSYAHTHSLFTSLDHTSEVSCEKSGSVWDHWLNVQYNAPRRMLDYSWANIMVVEKMHLDEMHHENSTARLHEIRHHSLEDKRVVGAFES